MKIYYCSNKCSTKNPIFDFFFFYILVIDYKLDSFILTLQESKLFIKWFPKVLQTEVPIFEIIHNRKIK